MKLLFITILLCFLNSCTKAPEHCKQADTVMFSFSKEQQKKNDLFIVGFGGAMMYDIQKFNLHYICEKMTLDESTSRKFFIEIATEFIEKVNNDPKIRPYLHNYPITINNLSLSIAFCTKNYLYPTEKYVAYIFNHDDLIYTCHHDNLLGKFYNTTQQPRFPTVNTKPVIETNKKLYCQSESSINNEIADGN